MQFLKHVFVVSTRLM